MKTSFLWHKYAQLALTILPVIVWLNVQHMWNTFRASICLKSHHSPRARYAILYKVVAKDILVSIFEYFEQFRTDWKYFWQKYSQISRHTSSTARTEHGHLWPWCQTNPSQQSTSGRRCCCVQLNTHYSAEWTICRISWDWDPVWKVATSSNLRASLRSSCNTTASILTCRQLNFPGWISNLFEWLSDLWRHICFQHFQINLCVDLKTLFNESKEKFWPI